MTKNDKRFHITVSDDNTVRLVNHKSNNNLISIGFKEHSDAVDCSDALQYLCNLMNDLSEENEQLKTENTMLKEHQNINCQNCQYFVSDSVSSDCLKREDIGYKGTCIDGMDLHMLAKNCPYY